LGAAPDGGGVCPLELSGEGAAGGLVDWSGLAAGAEGGVSVEELEGGAPALLSGAAPCDAFGAEVLGIAAAGAVAPVSGAAAGAVAETLAPVPVAAALAVAVSRPQLPLERWAGLDFR
jgi:hypothetical protein